jgi:hypothetical protein
MSGLPVIAEGLVIRPGDTLLLRVDRRLSLAEREELDAQLRPLKDRHGIEVVFLEDFGQMAVVRKRDETAV